MRIANVELTLAKEGHHVFLTGVTPAELLLLVAEHHANVGKDPVVSLVETNLGIGKEEEIEVEFDAKDDKGQPYKKKEKRKVTNIERSPLLEVARLRGKYAGNKVTALFPGASPNLPSTFDEARKIGPTIVLPTAKLTEFRLM